MADRPFDIATAVRRAVLVALALSALMALPLCAAKATPLCAAKATFTVSALAYGAKGDGIHDDTTAIRRAIKAVQARGGGTVRLPRGTYRVTSITLPTGVNLAGDGMRRSWLKGRIEVGSRSRVSDLKVGVDGASFGFTNGATKTSLERVAFTGGGGLGGDGSVISLPSRRGASFITFLGCTINANPHGGNGVSVCDNGWLGATYHDIVWQRCHFLGSPRMDFECIQRPDRVHAVTTGYYNINLIACVFEPSGSEAVSFDGSALCGRSMISGCTIKGAGNDPSADYGSGLEINGPTNFTVQNTTIYRTRGSLLNLQCRVPLSGWTFTYCSFDASQNYQTVPMETGARVIAAHGMNSAVFARCTFNAGSSAYNIGWLNGCSRNDFRTSTFLGSANNASVSQVNGSSDNLMP